jgi:hypothetical protein
MRLICAKITFAIEFLYLVSTVTTKISILLFFRRLVTGSMSRTFRWAVYSAIAFVIAYFVTFTITLFTTCRPFYVWWLVGNWFWYEANKDKGVFKCDNEGRTIVASAAISALQDFVACGLPITLFWKLRIPTKQKIALGGIFTVGFL